MSARRAVWLPSSRQLLLLRASLWKGEPALAAWAEWRREEPDLDTIEPGSYRLLPLLYRNLGPQLGADPDAARLKGIYRRSWAANQLGLRTGRQAIEALHAAGLEVLVLKGAALLSSAYGDPGARPMDDVDLAVRSEHICKAVRTLRETGFTTAEAAPERLLGARHSLAFHDPNSREVDLHREMLWRPGLDEEFWQDSIEADVAGARVRILNPADQLLHVCAHGAAWNQVHPVRWAADAFKILAASGVKFEWDRLVALAGEGRLTLPLYNAISYLDSELEAPIPAGAIRGLAAIPVSRRERRAHEALAAPPSPRRSASMLWWFWERHRAQAQLEGKRPTPAGLVRYMQGFWGLEHPSRVPAYAARRLLRRRTEKKDDRISKIATSGWGRRQ